MCKNHLAKMKTKQKKDKYSRESACVSEIQALPKCEKDGERERERIGMGMGKII